MGNPYHRPDGKFGTKHERLAYAAGLAKGISRGIAMGVSMAARALFMPVQRLWNVIHRRREERREAA
jgi:hypothetical protein